MLKKTITFETFDGETVTEVHFFHLSKAELIEMEVSKKGGLSEALSEIIRSNDGKLIIEEFKKLVLGSYGKKSDDGRRFIKSDEIRDEFESSEAYSTLFMELVTNPDSAAEFVNGIIPKGLEADVSKIGQEDQAPDAPNLRPDPSIEASTRQRILTQKEITEMPADELQELLASGKARLSSSDD